MQEIKDRMMTSLQAMDAEALFRTWLPAQIQGFAGPAKPSRFRPKRSIIKRIVVAGGRLTDAELPAHAPDGRCL